MALLYGIGDKFGWSNLWKFYGVPYLAVNHWLVMITVRASIQTDCWLISSCSYCSICNIRQSWQVLPSDSTIRLPLVLVK